MEREKLMEGLRAEARKSVQEARNLLSWLYADIQVIEHGLDNGESLGLYKDELRFMRCYIEQLTRLMIEAYGYEETMKILNENEDLKGDSK